MTRSGPPQLERAVGTKKLSPRRDAPTPALLLSPESGSAERVGTRSANRPAGVPLLRLRALLELTDDLADREVEDAVWKHGAKRDHRLRVAADAVPGLWPA